MEPKLLSDSEMQKFICDGFLVLPPVVPAELSASIYQKLNVMIDEDYNPGNNVLPRVPELQCVLDAPEVRGALQSVLGTDYVLHPHRYCHSNFPGEDTADGPKVGEGSTTFVGWHQDSHSPLGRPRHHFPEYAMLLYYPQDTPPELGPTQLIPATQYHRALGDSDRAHNLQASGDAGTCVLTHFDIGHGASLNVSDHCRHMLKFVFARASEPTQPSWDFQDPEWRTPHDTLSPHDKQAVWQWIWTRLRGGNRGTYEREVSAANVQDLVVSLTGDSDLDSRLQACNELAELGPAASDAIPALITSFEGPEPLRQNAIYALAAIGEAAVPALSETLTNADGECNEGAFVLEDSAYALSAIGPAALPALEVIARHDDEWLRVNGLFAIGEMGAAAVGSLSVLRSALADESHMVVRTALDALGHLGLSATPAVPEILALLRTNKNSQWTEKLRREWSGAEVVRMNAVMALLRIGLHEHNVEESLLNALGDDCGYVNGFAIEALLRFDSPTALRGTLNHLQTHRWDDTLIRNVRTF